MRGTFFLIVTAGAIALSWAANADGLFRPPNPLELKSMYCMAILQAEVMDRTGVFAEAFGLSRKSISKETGRVQAEILGRIKSNMQRIRRFLLPQLLDLDPIPLATASASGTADYKGCSAATNRVVSGIPEVLKSCERVAPARIANCVNSWVASHSVPACAGVKTCNGPPSWLPY